MEESTQTSTKMAHALLVLPDDSARPIHRAIDAARRTLRVKMFAFSDPAMLRALISAKRRGVKVRVMLNVARRDGEHDNDAVRRALACAGVEVKDSSPAFDLTHEKSMVVDDGQAFVQSLNWTTKNLQKARDYAIVTTHRHDVLEIVDCFEADWHRQAFAPRTGGRLVWCPGPGRERICRLIDGTRHTLWIQNERLQDSLIIERLVRAARRGVKVRVMARAPHSLKRDKLVEGVGGLRILDDLGVRVHAMKHLKLHAKMMLADGVAALVGSINFAAGSFDRRRELAIEVGAEDIVDRLHRIVRHDWKHSHPLDLSDDGLLADLDDRLEDGAQLLGIRASGPARYDN